MNCVLFRLMKPSCNVYFVYSLFNLALEKSQGWKHIVINYYILATG